MKIELILVQYLYNNKELTLQGIGTFNLDSTVTLPADTEKEVSIPANAITFNYNSKAVEDDRLIDFIVTHTKKIKPLASADLDSFLILGRQFLNIGKPFTLEGIGTLNRSHQGELAFIPGQFINAKLEAPKSQNEAETQESNVNFHEYGSTQEGNNKRPVMIGLLILLVATIAFAVWFYGYHDRTETAVPVTPPAEAADSTALASDSTANALAADSTAAPFAGIDHNFRIVIRESTDFKSIEGSSKKLTSWGHDVRIYTTDSLNYKLVELFSRPLSDTAMVRDSLKRYFGSNLRVETN